MGSFLVFCHENNLSQGREGEERIELIEFYYCCRNVGQGTVGREVTCWGLRVIRSMKSTTNKGLSDHHPPPHLLLQGINLKHFIRPPAVHSVTIASQGSLLITLFLRHSLTLHCRGFFLRYEIDCFWRYLVILWFYGNFSLKKCLIYLHTFKQFYNNNYQHWKYRFSHLICPLYDIPFIVEIWSNI